MDAKGIVTLVVAGAVALVWAILEIKRWRSGRKARAVESENNLLPNPARCADHEERIRKTESICIEIPARIHGLEANVAEIKGDVKSLIQLHLSNNSK